MTKVFVLVEIPPRPLLSVFGRKIFFTNRPFEKGSLAATLMSLWKQASYNTPEQDELTATRPEWKRWKNATPYQLKLCCLIWHFAKFTLILYLCFRQHRVLQQQRQLPPVLRGKVPRDSFERARNYQMSLNYLKMVSCFYWMAHKCIIISLAGFTGMWFISGPILDKLGFWRENWDRETGESIVFIWIIVGHINLVQIPLDLWKTFVIEEAYGFNKISFFTYLWDWMKLVFLELVFGTVIGIGILWIVQETGAYFVLWLWLFSFIWLMVGLAVYPNLIAPIFDTYTPLHEGRLKARLRKLAHFLGFPLEDILVLNHSWRSEKRMAYFFGLLDAKRVILYDTLLRGNPEVVKSTFVVRPESTHHSFPPPERSDSLESVPSRILQNAGRSVEDIVRRAFSKGGGTFPGRIPSHDAGFTEHEIEAIVARLMGQWILGHTIKELVYPVVSLFVFYLLFAWVYSHSSIYLALASMEGQLDKPILLGLRLIYADVMDVYRLFVEFVMRHLNRQHYYEADEFATTLGYGQDLIDYYIKTERKNLAYPYFDSWYWNFLYSEPPILDCIEGIQKEMENLEWKNK